ncbi:MAG: hypothetical protein GC162_04915 [Planctomycetes bacterium]|nr:hypothetical protein [Planctomycetota bacterium]
MRYADFNFESFRANPSYRVWASRAQQQPSWTWKYAALAAVLVLIVPIVVLVAAAVFMFVIIFAILSVLAYFNRVISGWTSGSGGAHMPMQDDDGRRNVRVVK